MQEMEGDMLFRPTRVLTASLVLIVLSITPVLANEKLKPKRPQIPQISFDMIVSGGAASCLPNAAGHVRVVSLGPVEAMFVHVEGLPPDTEFDFFVIQVPAAPFGLSWYQGDIDTDHNGRGDQVFLGRFSIETFIVAPGSASAPVVHSDGQFPDASSNPETPPVHTFHLGLWFNSPDDASKAGCPNTETPFNGDHTAGIQVLNTSNFADDQGPLRQLTP
jgi:hypothetical protein